MRTFISICVRAYIYMAVHIYMAVRASISSLFESLLLLDKYIHVYFQNLRVYICMAVRASISSVS